jgi:hypothetical protein
MVLLASPGCFGRFAMTGAVRKFNLDLTTDQWGREIAFVALYIIPVYPFCATADLLVVNSIEFWSEENPINGEKAITLSSAAPAAAPEGSPLVATAAPARPEAPSSTPPGTP